ncbi:MAG TPA: hypothetical protein O0Y05_04265, partial [Methanocorpusculum sp.]|nr:hypothetical protein [Methanocorpusculum sp.]
KKQTVIDKLKAFFERFFGIGGSLFTEDLPAEEIVDYTEAIQKQQVQKVAEELVPYEESR